MKRSGPLKRKKALAPGEPLGHGKKRKPLKARSQKRERRLKNDYWPALEQFFRDRPTCEICEGAPSTDPHHKAHRDNAHLTDWDNIMALCHPCHVEVHRRVKWARKMRYLVSPNRATVPLNQKMPLASCQRPSALDGSPTIPDDLELGHDTPGLA